MGPVAMTFAAISVASSVAGAFNSFGQQQRQADMMRQQAAFQRQQALQMQQQAQYQNAVMMRQADYQNKVSANIAKTQVQNANTQARLAAIDAKNEALRITQQAKQNALAETRQAEAMMDEQRDRRDLIELAYADSGITLEGSPAYMLKKQREVDRLNVETMQWENYNKRRNLRWQANEVVKGGEAAANAIRYQGLVESQNTLMQADVNTANTQMQASLNTYQSQIDAQGARNRAMISSQRAGAARQGAWSSLISGLGQAAGNAAMFYSPQPSTTPTTQLTDVPVGPSYFKAGNPVRTLPTGPSYFRG